MSGQSYSQRARQKRMIGKSEAAKAGAKFCPLVMGACARKRGQTHNPFPPGSGGAEKKT